MSICIIARIKPLINASCDIFADSAFLSILYELTFCTTCKRNAKSGSSLRLILKNECIFAHLTYAFLTFDQYRTCYFCHDFWIRKLFPKTFRHIVLKNTAAEILKILLIAIRFVTQKRTDDNLICSPLYLVIYWDNLAS